MLLALRGLLLALVISDEGSRAGAAKIVSDEVSNVERNPSVVKANGCAACHVLFTLKESMQISEQDAADLLSEVLLDDAPLNDRFIAMVEEIHMKARMLGGAFSIKTREAKDRYIDANFKNTLSELASDVSAYGPEIVLRRLLISNIALALAQNLGIDYHAATEELYYYMRKLDEETHSSIMEVVNQVLRRPRQP